MMKKMEKLVLQKIILVKACKRIKRIKNYFVKRLNNSPHKTEIKKYSLKKCKTTENVDNLMNTYILYD
jgi:hypothetical protein